MMTFESTVPCNTVRYSILRDQGITRGDDENGMVEMALRNF